MNRLVTTFLCGLSRIAWSAEAHAASVTYEAEATCPSKEDFEARVEERASRAQDAEVTVRARIDDPSAGFVGEVRRPDGEIVRRVEGRTCDAVVDALVLALSLDASKGDANTPAMDSSMDSSSAAGEILTTAKASPSKNASSSGANAPNRTAGPELTDSRDRGTSLGDSHESRVTWAVGGNLSSGWTGDSRATKPTLGGWSGILFTEAAALGALGVSRYRPTLRGGLKAIWSKETLITDAGGFYGVQIDACPIGFLVISSKDIGLALSACAHTHLGLADWRSRWCAKSPTYCSDNGIDKGWRNDFVFGAGGLARVALQFGGKGKLRGFVEASYDLGVGIPAFAFTEAAYYDASLGGGVLFP